tara:strand:- start:1564 stop:1758 length:195 start_codon:yes stop_codon:yes gene_type:complete
MTDQYFLADARNRDHAVLAARRDVGHPNPTGAILIAAAVPIPGELLSDPRVFIAEDPLTGWTSS